MLLFKHMQVWLRHVSLDHPYFPSVVYTQERTEQILKLHFWKTLTERETLSEFFPYQFMQVLMVLVFVIDI